jgi:hypothetical protein
MQAVFIERAQRCFVVAELVITHETTEHRDSKYCLFILYLTVISAVHRPGINTTNRCHLHKPTANFSRIQKSKLYTGIEIFNSLPWKFKSTMNEKG